jgi:opacity protein-like surface antigen
MFNSADAEDKATLFPIGGGGGIAYDKGDIAAGVNVEYHYPMFDFSETFGNNTYTESFKGNAVSPSAGFLVTKKNIKWVSAVNYKWMSLNGRSDTFALGDLTSSGYSAKTRLLFVPGPVRAAAFIQYDNRTTEYADEQGNLWFDAVYQTYAFGAGTGWGTKKLTVGLEGGLQINTINNRLDTLSSTSQALFGKAGLEYAVMKDLYLRGGYNFDQVDPDLEGSSDRTKTHTVTGGVGLNIISGMRLDIAYNYRMGKTQLLPDENITDHILLVYFRYILKESSGNF